jgi:hypothetical protein
MNLGATVDPNWTIQVTDVYAGPSNTMAFSVVAPGSSISTPTRTATITKIYTPTSTRTSIISSATSTFTPTSSLLQKPTLYTPLNSATGVYTNTTFSWSAVTGANRYWLTVSTNKSDLPTNISAVTCTGCISTGLSGITDATSYIAGNAFPYKGTTKVLNANTTYYWEVQAYNTDGTMGYYSAQWSFTTGSGSTPTRTNTPTRTPTITKTNTPGGSASTKTSTPSTNNTLTWTPTITKTSTPGGSVSTKTSTPLPSGASTVVCTFTATKTNTQVIYAFTPTYTATQIYNGNSYSYPNPFVFSRNNRINFVFKPASDAYIEIYDVSLSKILRFNDSMVSPSEGKAFWDGKDVSGICLPSGVYFAVVNSKNGGSIIKFTIIK